MDKARPRRRADVRVELLPDGSAVLYDGRSQMAYAVTASAAEVWEVCDGAHTPAMIAERLSGIYDATPERIVHDVEALLAQLHEMGLLEATPGTSA